MILEALRSRIRSQLQWTRLRWLVQISALLLFFASFVQTGASDFRPDRANLFIRLDPLTSLLNLISSRVVVPGLILALVIVGVTLLLGRVWCGWLCPLGTILDVFSFKRFRKKSLVTQPNWRKVKYLILLALLFAALFGNLSLVVLDPVTLLIRSLTSGIWPMLDRLVLTIEQSAYQIPALQAPVILIDGIIRPSLFPYQSPSVRAAALYSTLLIGVVLANLISRRFWCRYLCPLGAFLGLLSKFSLVRRNVRETCGECGACAADCPLDIIQPELEYSSDPAECTVCMECVDGCPLGSTSFRPTTKLAGWETYDPSRREALATFGAAAAGALFLRSGISGDQTRSDFIQPPGGYENRLLSRCLRCGQCIRTCPTGALQPALLEAGAEGIWTPIVIPRLGYCDFSCNACGQICPVEAIPPIALEVKRSTPIGKAVIDRERCIAWKGEAECIVCEEMCPLPEKAIWLETEAGVLGQANVSPIQVPYVNTDTCIGCGICEYKCPVPGQAAIRIHSLTSNDWQTVQA